MQFVEKLNLFETHIDKSHFTEEQLERIDYEATRRFHLVIRWKEVNDDVCLIIRDLLKIQYWLKYKVLQNTSYKYVAQKTNTNGSDTNIESANILIEPLNNDFKGLIHRIPINQKLDIGTEVLLNKSIPYNPDEKGMIPDRKFLHSGNLEFNTKIPNPIPNFFHIGAMEIGSNIKAKFIVQYADPVIEKFRLFSFLRQDECNVFVLQLWNFYGINFKELFDLMIDYIENGYKPIEYYTISANDYGNKIIDKDGLLKFVKGLSQGIEKLKIEEVNIGDLLEFIIGEK